MNSPDAPSSPLMQFLEDLDHRLSGLEQMIQSNARSIAASTEIMADMKTVQAQTVKNVEKLVGSVLKLAEHLEADQERRHRILDILLQQAERESQVLDSLSSAQERQADILSQLMTIHRETLP